VAKVAVAVSCDMQHEYENDDKYLNLPVFHKAEITIDIVRMRQEGQEI
jgi:hypothetical protein